MCSCAILRLDVNVPDIVSTDLNIAIGALKLLYTSEIQLEKSMKNELKMTLMVLFLSAILVASGSCDTNKNFTLVSKDMAAQDILQMIARSAKINLIFGKDVYGTLSVNFDKVPPMEALQDICTACDLVLLEFDTKDHINLIVSKSRTNEFKEMIEGMSRTRINDQRKTTFKNRSVAVTDIILMTARMGKIDIQFDNQTEEKLRACKMSLELDNVSPMATIQAICMMNDVTVRKTADSNNGRISLLIQ